MHEFVLHSAARFENRLICFSLARAMSTKGDDHAAASRVAQLASGTVRLAQLSRTDHGEVTRCSAPRGASFLTADGEHSRQAGLNGAIG